MTTTELTEFEDAQLVALAKGGDFAAFEQLVNRHERRIYQLALRILRQREDAEDVTQTALLKALEKIDSFREEAAFATWLGRIAVNTALKLLRKRRGLPMRAPLGGADEDLPAMAEQIVDWRADLDKTIERRELARLLDAALEELSEKYRIVFVLRDIEGLSVKETAVELGLTESNVKVRLMRARLALRDKLSAVFGDQTTKAPAPQALLDRVKARDSE